MLIFTILALSVIIVSPALSADGIAPYVLHQDPYVPVPIQALPETKRGVVSLPEYGDQEITIYLGSTGSTGSHSRYFYEPYIAISREQLRNIYKEKKCEDPQEIADDFTLEFNVEVGSRRLAKAIAEEFQEIEEHSVGIFQYSLIELVDSYSHKVIWRTPRSIIRLIPTDNTIEWGMVQSVSSINCEDLNRYSRFRDALEARAVLPSALTTNRVGRLQVRQFRDHLLDFTLDQDAGAIGTLEQIAVTTTRGRTKNSPAILGFISNSSSSGSTATTVKSTEEDTRERWINREGLRKAVLSYVRNIEVTTWCVKEDQKCNAEGLQDNLFDLLDTNLKTQYVELLTRPPQESDGTGTYISISQPGAIQRLREASMNPSFWSKEGNSVDCNLLVAAASSEGGAQSNGPSPLTSPSETAPTSCGLNSETTVSDKNNIKWAYKGQEWIPISIDLAYVSDDSFSGIENTVIMETTSSGAVSISHSIPLIDRKVNVGCKVERMEEFGGGGGRPFPEAAPSKIQLRAGDFVDALILNDKRYGGRGGTLSGLMKLELKQGEYINRMVIRHGKYVDRLEFSTNSGKSIAGGGGGGSRSLLENIRILRIGGRSGRYLDRIVVTYCVE